MKKSDQIFQYLENKVFNGTWLNDNHNNYHFLEFWDNFYKGKKFDQVKSSFHYHMKKLVDCGMCKKSVGYLSERDYSNFGRKTIITYVPLIKNTR